MIIDFLGHLVFNLAIGLSQGFQVMSSLFLLLYLLSALLQVSPLYLSISNPLSLSLTLSILPQKNYQNDSEWPKMDFKHNFENRDFYFLFLKASLTLTLSISQVAILLHLASVLVTSMWARAIDPDNAAIPYLTATGDLLGGALLPLVFYVVNSLD